MERHRPSALKIILICVGGVMGLFLAGALLLWGLFEWIYSEELIGQYPSWDGTHCVQVILSDGGATTPWTILCDVTGEDLEGGKRRIYVKNHCNEAEVRWLDERTVEVNGVILDIYLDKHSDRGLEE